MALCGTMFNLGLGFDNSLETLFAPDDFFRDAHPVGDVSLIGIKDGIVTLNISGACVGCSLADLTYNKLIGGLLKEEVPGIKEVKLIK